MSEDDDAPKNEKQEGSSHEEDEIIDRLTQWERRARSHWSRWRDETRTVYAFVAGDQWSSEDKAALLDQLRQPIVFNRAAPMVDAVIGAEVLNRQEVSYSPREIGDAGANELISGAAKWARQQCDAEDEESDAFSDAIICGMGWTETRMDYEEDPEGLVRIDRVDPLEMWSDPDAKKRNLADRRFQFRARWMNRDEIPEAWREKARNMSSDGADVATTSARNDDPDDDYNESLTDRPGDAEDKRIWVRHFQWWELEDGYKISDPQTGQVAMMKPDQYKQLVQQFLQTGMRPPEVAKMRVRVYKQAFMAGSGLLEPVSEIPGNAFTFNCVTGKRDRNRGIWYGIVRAMLDPQMWANKWLTQILHILNTSSNGGLMYEKDAVENPRELLENWAKPNMPIEVKSGALAQNRIQEREPRAFPQGLSNMMEFAVGSMPQVTGINLELLGLVQKEQAGVLEAQRKQAGYAILAVFFDSLRRYRKMQGRVMLHFIQQYMSDGRLIRIVGKNGTDQYVPLVRQPDTIKYDVVVDEAPMSANQKESVWQMMTQLMPMLMKSPVAMPALAEALKYSPLPAALSQKFAEALSKAGEPDPEKSALEMEGAKLELAKKSAQAFKDQAAGEKALAEAGQMLWPMPDMTAGVGRGGQPPQQPAQPMPQPDMGGMGDVQMPMQPQQPPAPMGGPQLPSGLA